uniref:RING-type domain-containing protein n=1 Tax=Globodera pallida TaxID=36090 RepID=A0A183BXI5_GLOPA
MNRARRRLVFEEVVQRTAAQQQQHVEQPPLPQPQQQVLVQQQELYVPQQQQQDQPLEEDIDQQQQQQEAERERQLDRCARNVRLQLRESRRFSAGAPASVFVLPAQIFRANECIVCFSAEANFYVPSCGHMYLCVDCAVHAVLNKVETCMMCRAEIIFMTRFWQSALIWI